MAQLLKRELLLRCPCSATGAPRRARRSWGAVEQNLDASPLHLELPFVGRERHIEQTLRVRVASQLAP